MRTPPKKPFRNYVITTVSRLTPGTKFLFPKGSDAISGIIEYQSFANTYIKILQKRRDFFSKEDREFYTCDYGISKNTEVLVEMIRKVPNRSKNGGGQSEI